MLSNAPRQVMRRVKAIGGFVVVCAMVFAAPTLASGGKGGDSIDAPTAGESHTFDPVLRALGVNGADEVTALQRAQKQLASEVSQVSAGRLRIFGNGEISEIRSEIDHEDIGSLGGVLLKAASVQEWGEALDDLYLRVASRPEAEEQRKEWRDCMESEGFSVDNREEFMDALLEASQAELSSASSASEICDARQARALSHALEAEFIQWETENAGVISNYREALGIQ